LALKKAPSKLPSRPQLALSALAVGLEDEFTADLDLPLLIQR